MKSLKKFRLVNFLFLFVAPSIPIEAQVPFSAEVAVAKSKQSDILEQKNHSLPKILDDRLLAMNLTFSRSEKIVETKSTSDYSPALLKFLARLTPKQRLTLQELLDAGIVTEAEVLKTGGKAAALKTLIQGAWRRHELDLVIEASLANGILRKDQVAKARKEPQFLKDLLRISANGQLLGLDDSEIKKATDAYTARGGAAGRAAAEKVLIGETFKSQFGIGLPDNAFNAFPNPRTLLSVLADFQLTGLSDKATVSALTDPAFFNKVKSQGTQQAVLSVLYANDPGSPLFAGADAVWQNNNGKFQRTGRATIGGKATSGTSSTKQTGSTSSSSQKGSGSSGNRGSNNSTTYDPNVWADAGTGETGNNSSGSSGTSSGSSGSTGSGSGSTGSSGAGSTTSGSGSGGSSSSGSSGGTGSGTSAGNTTGNETTSSGGSSTGSTGSSSSGSQSGSSTNSGSSSASSGGTNQTNHGGRRYMGTDSEKNSDGTTTVVSYFSDGSYIEGVYDSNGNQVSRTEVAGGNSTLDDSGEDATITYIPPENEEDNSGADAKMSGDPADPDSYRDPKIAGLISGVASELMAMQLYVRQAKAGGATDPERGDAVQFTRTKGLVIPDKVFGLLVGDDRRGGDGRAPYQSVGDPSLFRAKDPGTIDPDRNK